MQEINWSADVPMCMIGKMFKMTQTSFSLNSAHSNGSVDFVLGL